MHKASIQGSVRIISGEWRSRRIRIPPDDRTRPMLDRVKAAVFDMLGSYFGTPGRLPSLAVADVFAGGGTLGLEALSRGARTCVFVERDAQALAVLRQNLRDLHVGPQGVIEPIDAFGNGLADVLAEHGCGLVLLDPPYQDLRDEERRRKLASLLGAMSRRERWADPPVVLLHHPVEVTMDVDALGSWHLHISRQYGTSGIALLTLVGAVSDRDHVGPVSDRDSPEDAK